MKYRLAPNVELTERDGKRYLLSKAPLSLIEVNRSLVWLVERLLAAPVEPASESERKVLEQLAVRGLVQRVSQVAVGDDLPEVSIVIPVLDRADELRRCLASIRALTYPEGKIEVIVVDDGSRDESAAVARSLGARVVSSGGVRRGPAAARNVGARFASGEILAFIDSDCTASPLWLNELIPLFSDATMAAVGGLVDGMCTESAVDRYEAVMSSLSLGGRERFGRGGDDTFYLPSCNLLVRRAAFLAVNGFADAMHVGEDVDLTWRLRDAGWAIAYLPTGRVLHEHRSTVLSFMSRRFDYGTSEGMLQKLHPRRRKKFVLPPVPGTVLALLLLAPFTTPWLAAAALLLVAGDAGSYAFRLSRRGMPLSLPTLLGARLRSLGGLGYYLSYHIIRYYLPVLILLALAVPQLRLLALLIYLTAAGVDYFIKRPDLSFGVFAGIYALEQFAYGAGVFWGCLCGRGFSTYRVVLLRRMELTA